LFIIQVKENLEFRPVAGINSESFLLFSLRVVNQLTSVTFLSPAQTQNRGKDTGCQGSQLIRSTLLAAQVNFRVVSTLLVHNKIARVLDAFLANSSITFLASSLVE